MTDTFDTTLIADLARDTVQQVAPQELPRFRATSQAYFEDPGRVLKGEKSKDEMLGFGTGAELTFLTPIVLAMSTQVVNFLAGEMAASLKGESSSAIRDLVKMLFKRLQRTEDGDRPAATPTPLTSEQLARVRQVAYDTASRLKVSDREAGLLADSLLGGLLVGTG